MASQAARSPSHGVVSRRSVRRRGTGRSCSRTLTRYSSSSLSKLSVSHPRAKLIFCTGRSDAHPGALQPTDRAVPRARARHIEIAGPDFMASGRLLTLVKQAVAYQIESSRYHPRMTPKITTYVQDEPKGVLWPQAS